MATACVTRPHLYLEVLERIAPPAAAVAEARTLCAGCPQFERCLSTALTGPEADGFIAGTTRDERDTLRQALRLTNRTVLTDEYLPDDVPDRECNRAVVNHRRLAHIIRVHPGADLNEIARRADCSLGTVKRHLRDPKRAIAAWDRAQARNEPAPTTDEMCAAYYELRENPTIEINPEGQYMLPFAV